MYRVKGACLPFYSATWLVLQPWLNDSIRKNGWDVELRKKLEKQNRFTEYGFMWDGLFLHFGDDSHKAYELLDENICSCCLNVMDEYMGPLLAHILNTITIHSGEYQSALKLSQEAIDSMKDFHFRLFLPDFLMEKGRALIEPYRLDDGCYVLYNAYNEAVSIGSRRSALFVLAALVETEKRNNNKVKAEELRHEGKEIVEYISSKIEDPKLQMT